MDLDDFDSSSLDEDLIDALDETEKRLSPQKAPQRRPTGNVSIQPITLDRQEVIDQRELQHTLPRSRLRPSDSGAQRRSSHSKRIPKQSRVFVKKDDGGFHPLSFEDYGDDNNITISRAALAHLVRDACRVGREEALAKERLPFRFLDLPPELRLVFYEHYFADRNPKTSRSLYGIEPRTKAEGLPKRISDSNRGHCKHCSIENNIWCGTERPRISTNLLLACRQIYMEARDLVYKTKVFFVKACSFVEMQPFSSSLRFWQHIQHIDLEVGDAAARRDTGKMISHLVAMLQGGKHLKSFRLKYSAIGREQSITQFKYLQVKGPIRITQKFEDHDDDFRLLDDLVITEAARKKRLEDLLFSMLGCARHEAPAYDLIISSSSSGDVPFDDIDPTILGAERTDVTMTISTESD